MKNFSFNKIQKNRKAFMKKNSALDHVVVEGKGKVMLSAPHGVSQVRLGKLKYSEIGSLTTALYLQSQTRSALIAKTKNNNDDANFDAICPYRRTLKDCIAANKIEYLLDFHGLASERGVDINFGTHLGQNIETNPALLKSLCDALRQNGFSISIDQPFMAGAQTISGAMKKEFPNLWTVQIEINYAITNKIENAGRYECLLNILKNWIDDLNKN